MMALSRETIAQQYLDSLPYPPYPVQEEAILAYFTNDQGVLVCAPTGTGKTMIAQAALYEALATNRMAYYTTPLIALTEQKFHEMQDAVERWGFRREDVGLVTGNRKVNPHARLLIVVAEILLNRLLNPEEFDWNLVSAVVMDEFHSFADPSRGIVWELSLAMLPTHIRLMLLSATVGNAQEFLSWLDRCHHRKVELVEGTERKVPLTYHWIPNRFLGELLEEMVVGDETQRRTPALVFCFNRDECWAVAEQLKGLNLITSGSKNALIDEVEKHDWSQGAGTKLKQIIRRGVGVHHAGLLPRYRRVVEDLFEKKLLSVAVCTETLAAGINLPARSVVVTSLMKGPYGEEKLIDPSTAHQIFGRAGRPQYDTEGFVYVIAHEDDVRILRWKEKYDQIPEDTKDPMLIKKKKELKRKKPSRNENRNYWNDTHFEKLKNAPPGKLYSKGPLPWRLLAYLLKKSPDVNLIRGVIRKRLMDGARVTAGEKNLVRMLRVLADSGYVNLDPPPPPPPPEESVEPPPPYEIVHAYPTEQLDRLLAFRSVHPLYGAFLIDQLGIANQNERVQAFESVLELPRPLLKFVRVPWEMPRGPLASERLDPELIQRGLVSPELLMQQAGNEDEDEEEDRRRSRGRDRDRFEERPPHLAEKLRLYFDALRPDVTDVTTQAVWSAGEVLALGNFNLYVRNHDLIKQEGIVFRHLLRFILLLSEFMELSPPEISLETWQADLHELTERLTTICRAVDPTSTEKTIQLAHAADAVEGESYSKR